MRTTQKLIFINQHMTRIKIFVIDRINKLKIQKKRIQKLIIKMLKLIKQKKSQKNKNNLSTKMKIIKK